MFKDVEINVTFVIRMNVVPLALRTEIMIREILLTKVSEPIKFLQYLSISPGKEMGGRTRPQTHDLLLPGLVA